MAKVIVVGGGPSGIMAAISAAKQNHSVTLIERNEFLGKKLKLTGGGRCNITNYTCIIWFSAVFISHIAITANVTVNYLP